jgi:hypothetical protein
MLEEKIRLQKLAEVKKIEDEKLAITDALKSDFMMKYKKLRLSSPYK